MKRLNEYWFGLSDKIRFLFVGGFNALFAYLIYVLVLYISGDEHYQLALLLSWVISSVFSFSMQRMFVFKSSGKFLHEYLKCCTTWVFSYLINMVLLTLLVKYLFVNAYLAQIFANLTAAVFTYFMFKYFAFKHSAH